MPLDSAMIRISVDPETLENFQESVRAWTARWADRIEAEAISRRPARLMPVSNAEWHRHYVENAPTFDYTIRTAADPVVDTHNLGSPPPRPTPQPRPYGEPLQKGEHMLQLSPTLQSIVYDSGYDNRICALLAYDRYRLSTERIDYLDVDGDKLTYMPTSRTQEEYPDGTWKPTGRQAGRPAKVIRKMMSNDVKNEFTDKDFEVFANIIKSYDARSRGTFDLVEGDEIATLYNGDYSYMPDTGSMAASCMRYDFCEPFFGIYTDNPEIVKLLVLRDKKRTHKIHGRALVWFVPGFDTPIMDRVYGNDHTLQAFRAYAVEHGWYYRAFNTYQFERQFIKDGEAVNLKIRVALPRFKFDRFPYMDTMKFFDTRKGEFSNYETTISCEYLLDIHGHENISHRWLNHPKDYRKATSSVEIDTGSPVEMRTRSRTRAVPIADPEPMEVMWATEPVPAVDPFPVLNDIPTIPVDESYSYTPPEWFPRPRATPGPEATRLLNRMRHMDEFILVENDDES